MDDILKRRLIGALALLLIALGIAALLPPPGAPPLPEAGIKTYTVDLREPPPEAAAGGEAGAASPLAAAAADSVHAVPDSGESAESLPAAAPEPAAQDVATVLEPEAPPPPKPMSKPALKLEPALRSPPAARDEKESAAPSTPASPSQPAWYVQAGAFGDVANARQLLARLDQQGLRGIISPAETSGGTRYRARLGPYVERAEAEAARARLIEQGLPGTLVQE